MALFSERQGLSPEKAIQRESIDKDTRNALWTAVVELLDHRQIPGDYRLFLFREPIEFLVYRWWTEFYKHAGDEYPGTGNAIGEMRHWFFRAPWNQVFDLLEFIAQTTESLVATERGRVLELLLPHFVSACDRILVSECCAYRFVGGAIREITSQAEIDAIERGLKIPARPVAVHLKKALAFLTDRARPDYENSIKEAVSALEAAARDLTGNPNATLGDALKTIRSRAVLHPALERAITGLYGYASDEGGIRHAAKGASRVSQSEARLVLVAASAVCDFLDSNAADIQRQLG